MSNKVALAEKNDLTIKLYECIEDIDFLNSEEKAFLKISSDYAHFPKGEHIVRAGQYVRSCYTILKGCVKEYYLVNGEEKITNLYLETDSLTSMISVKENRPVDFYWECLEDVEVTFMSHEKELQLYKKIPKLETYSRECNEYYISTYKNEINQFLIASPEDRYLNILQNKPALIERVPLYILASYIGIKAESLSRIRKRMRDKAVLV